MGVSADNIVGLNQINPGATYVFSSNRSEGAGINVNGGQVQLGGDFNIGLASLGDSAMRIGGLGETIVGGFSTSTIRVPVIAQGPVTFENQSPFVPLGVAPVVAVLLENTGNQLGSVTVTNNLALAAAGPGVLGTANVTLGGGELIVLANASSTVPPTAYSITLNVTKDSMIDNNPRANSLVFVSDLINYKPGAVLLPTVNVGDANLSIVSSSVNIGTLNLVGNATLSGNGFSVGNITQDGGQRSLTFTSNITLGPITTVTGTLSATGPITVTQGGLRFDGISSPSSSPVTIGSRGAALAGNGVLHRPVVFTSDFGQTLAPDSPPALGGTLTVDSLVLGLHTNLQWDLGAAGVLGGPTNDLVVVNGDLTLDGQLTYGNGKTPVPGEYTLFTYGGVLTDDGLTVPAGDSVDLSVPGEVRLVVTAAPEAGTVCALGLGAVMVGWRRRRMG